MESQPTFNIGLIGHVAHGKTSTIRALTGIDTFRHSKENERGITIKIGYTNCKIFKCDGCCEPECYHSTNGNITNYFCDICKTNAALVKHFSFVDCPGHESLMNTMLSGATVMDYAILLIDGSQKCPQPQTIEHLAALEILGVQKIIIIQNKLDLIDGNRASDHYNDIKKFTKHTCAENAPIIPISAQKKYNIDILCEHIVKYFNENIISQEYDPKMNVIRSFDVNKPGSNITTMCGGVFGGSLIRGKLCVNDVIEIRPGIVTKVDNQITWKPITTTITSMRTDTTNIAEATTGGLIGVCTNLDPSYTKNDKMVGQVIGLQNRMPDVYISITASCTFIKRVDNFKIKKPNINDLLLVNIASKSIIAKVTAVNKLEYTLLLTWPCCINNNETFSLSQKINSSWRLIGMAKLIVQ